MKNHSQVKNHDIPENYVKVFAIDMLKRGTGGLFHRIKFKDMFGNFYKTDVVLSYGNAERWLELIKKGLGTMITSYKLYNKTTIDADSQFEYYQAPKQKKLI